MRAEGAPRPPRGRRIWSLRRRLLVWLLLATLITGALALLDTRAEARRTADQLADRVLAGSAMVIAERAALNASGVLEIAIPYGALEMLSSAAQDRVFYRVDSPAAGPDGRLVTGYADLPVASARPGAEPAFLDAIYRGVPVRVTTLARAVSTGIDEVPFTVTMAETTQAREALSRDILFRSALRLSGMIAGAALIVWIAVTVSLRPLAGLGAAISARSPDDLRPVETPVPSEILALVEAVNSLMRRLEGALAGLRNFTGNAAHQIRTPLTVIRTQLALAARAETLAEARRASGAADAALTRAERVLAQLLALARVDAAQGAPQAEITDLAPLVRDLTAEHIPPAAEAGVDLGFENAAEGEARPFLARIEPLLFGEAVHNLISNAILHAGAGSEVTLRLWRERGQIVVEVADNGPGIAPSARAAALARFGRATPERETVPGMGLGLPIVHEIARLFGGELDLAEGENGLGLRARIRLPEAGA